MSEANVAVSKIRIPKVHSYKDYQVPETFYYLANFELLYRDVCFLKVLSAEDLDFTKTKTKDIALHSFYTYNRKVPEHQSKEEFDALKGLLQNKHIVIQKSKSISSILRR